MKRRYSNWLKRRHRTPLAGRHRLLATTYIILNGIVQIMQHKHILFNAFSMGTGGGLTVGRELAYFLALAKPDWKMSLFAITDHPLHEELRSCQRRPNNVDIQWVPAGVIHPLKRSVFEKRDLVKWAADHKVDASIQLNGMHIPKMPAPTICHFQDPWPYRREAWTRRSDPAFAFLKRRAHRNSLRRANATTWTSSYLESLITQHHQIMPKVSRVLHNGVPDSWLDRNSNQVTPISERPPQVTTISNVSFYKRQWLVVEAIGKLVNEHGLSNVKYIIAGQATKEVDSDLKQRITRLGIEKNVTLAGRVSDEYAQQLFAESRVFSLMSVCESFGIPAIEAMTCGTPVVVANCCAIPEVCGDAGWLVEMDSVEELTAALCQALTDDGAASSAAQKGLVNAQQFRWSSTADRLATLIEDLT